MKKILIISFLVMYALSTVGVTILLHTCGGESETLIVMTTISDPCGCGDGMTAGDLCCTSELKTVKIDDSQKVATTTGADKPVAFILLPPVTVSPVETHYIQFITPINSSPPLPRDFQSSNSVFLI